MVDINANKWRTLYKDSTVIYQAAPIPLSVSISPTTEVIDLGQYVTFTSSVSGGTFPYSYQWYLDDAPVSGATSSSWTFTPTSTVTYYVYLKVTDACNSTAQSETAKITVRPPYAPVGGYSVSLTKSFAKAPLICYTMLLAIFGVAICLIRRKRK
ncbi:PKD domain-containing protein [Candidatus Bathyarchaeota archaeon]|nr:PKD domain-containing protein [Candidatus Bathyarchaeota archaeon]